MAGDFASQYLLKSTCLILKYYDTADPTFRMASHKREFVSFYQPIEYLLESLSRSTTEKNIILLYF